MTPKTIAILGAGERGRLFADLVSQLPEMARVVAVAEPRPAYRQAIAADRQFESWQDFLAQPKMCDAVVIATMDREHAAPAVACLQKGYDLLLEKPMAVTLADCRAIEQAQRDSGAIVGVCHSLRYQANFRKVRDLVRDGAIGRLMSVDLIEQVAWWHQAHSFVRGNWANESRSTFMLLSKSCHDIDYLCFLAGDQATRVNSFGHLSYFRREHAPPDSGERCVDCPIERQCIYSAVKQYCEGDLTRWPTCVVAAEHTVEAHRAAIAAGPYGRCVWKCDNDVVDHQVVSLQFPGDVTATFTMTAFTADDSRNLRVFGSEGEIAFDEQTIRLRRFGRSDELVPIPTESGSHGGGDARIVQEWLVALHSGDDRGVVADAQASLASHEAVFAAELSRREGRSVLLTELQAEPE